MDGLIIGTTFVIVTLLFIKIGEKIDRWFTRRHQKWLEPKAPTLNPGTGVPRYGPSYREMRATVRGQHVTMQPLPLWETEGFRQTLIAMGRAWRSIPIDTTLKGRAKPLFLTDQEWMDQTIDRSIVDHYENNFIMQSKLNNDQENETNRLRRADGLHSERSGHWIFR